LIKFTIIRFLERQELYSFEGGSRRKRFVRSGFVEREKMTHPATGGHTTRYGRVRGMIRDLDIFSFEEPAEHRCIRTHRVSFGTDQNIIFKYGRFHICLTLYVRPESYV